MLGITGEKMAGHTEERSDECGSLNFGVDKKSDLSQALMNVDRIARDIDFEDFG